MSVTIWTASAGRSTPGQAAEAQDRGGHPGAGVAGGHDRVGLAALDQVDRDEDRRVLLLAQGERRVLVHADDLAGVDDRDVRRQRPPASAADDRLVADEDDPVLGVRPGVVEGAGDDLGRAVIAAHRVDRDADPGGRRLAAGSGCGVGHRVSGAASSVGGWLELDRQAAVVVAAVRADVVRLLHLVAVRALLERAAGSMARCARRSPWRACETRRLGTPMGSWAPSDHRASAMRWLAFGRSGTSGGGCRTDGGV